MSLQNSRNKKIQIYLKNHFGLSDAILFIKNKITEDKAVRLLKAQVGVKSAATRCEKEGDYIKAHRKWLMSYMKESINLEDYFCPELTKPPKLEDVNLDIVLGKI